MFPIKAYRARLKHEDTNMVKPSLNAQIMQSEPSNFAKAIFGPL